MGRNQPSFTLSDHPTEPGEEILYRLELHHSPIDYHEDFEKVDVPQRRLRRRHYIMGILRQEVRFRFKSGEDSHSG